MCCVVTDALLCRSEPFVPSFLKAVPLINYFHHAEVFLMGQSAHHFKNSKGKRFQQHHAARNGLEPLEGRRSPSSSPTNTMEGMRSVQDDEINSDFAKRWSKARHRVLAYACRCRCRWHRAMTWITLFRCDAFWSGLCRGFSSPSTEYCAGLPEPRSEH